MAEETPRGVYLLVEHDGRTVLRDPTTGRDLAVMASPEPDSVLGWLPGEPDPVHHWPFRLLVRWGQRHTPDPGPRTMVVYSYAADPVEPKAPLLPLRDDDELFELFERYDNPDAPPARTGDLEGFGR